MNTLQNKENIDYPIVPILGLVILTGLIHDYAVPEIKPNMDGFACNMFALNPSSLYFLELKVIHLNTAR